MTAITAVANQTAKETLLAQLIEYALKIGEVKLSNGRTSSYYVDVKQAIMRPVTFLAAGQLVAEQAHKVGAKAVGGLTIGADPVACAAIAVPEGSSLVAFLVRKEQKKHGLQRWIEGPEMERGTPCLVVDDVVTTGASTIEAIERMRHDGLAIVGALAVVDRLAGGGEAIAEAAGAPFRALVTIDELYPDRPDRDS